MDVGYVLGPQAEYEELRYSLRSLRFLPHGEVWIAGAELPEWCQGVNWIPVDQLDGYRNRPTNQRRHLLALLDHPEVSDEFVFMHDDFVFTRPLDEVPLPSHVGTIAETHSTMEKHAGPYQELYHWWQSHPEYGVSDPLRIPEHVPLRVDGRLGGWMREVWHIHGFPIQSLWVNNAHLPVEKGHDFLLKDDWPDGWAVSTTSSADYTGPHGERLRSLHPDPSPYENTSIPIPTVEPSFP